MEQELNIAAILRDKPNGTKLYSRISGDCILEEVNEESPFPINVSSTNTRDWCYLKDGKYVKDGEVCLFPSKAMQDWSKFDWEKGDVLGFANVIVIFDRWINNDYTEFKAAFECNQGIEYDKGNNYHTSEFNKVSNDTAQKFIKNVETHFGGKLNQSTLEIEKPQFKDGDIVFVSSNASKLICIFKTISYGNYNYVKCYLEFSVKSNYLYDGYISYDLSVYKFRFATDSEKQQLFDALAKEGKCWNAETKTLEDLPKKCELKAFDKVLVRDSKEKRWDIDLFKIYHRGKFPYVCLIDMWKFCIPYNEQTKHLLGTTDDWKGGEE